MAESLADKLKRLAAEKKLKAAGVAPVVAAQPAVVEQAPITVPVIEVTSNDPQDSSNKESLHGSNTEGGSAPTGKTEPEATVSTECESTSESGNGLVHISAATDSQHPLAMQFAELEAQLLAKDPEFKTVLRQVHRHLGQDPELVTMMTPEEVQMVVTGMVLFANMEIVEPAKAKSAKAAVAKIKKAVISADDL